MQLGDAIPGGNSDLLYTGATGESPLSMDFYRNKAREFQTVLDALDQGYNAAWDAVAADVSGELSDQMYELIGEFDAKKTVLRLTAEAINGGAAAINAIGGRFPQLSIPSGLGILPALPVAAIAAIATAGTLIVWGNTWLRGLNDRLRQAQLLEVAGQGDPAKAAALADALARSDAAVRASEASPISSIANVVKWGAIGFLAFLAFRAYRDRG